MHVSGCGAPKPRVFKAGVFPQKPALHGPQGSRPSLGSLALCLPETGQGESHSVGFQRALGSKVYVVSVAHPEFFQEYGSLGSSPTRDATQ